MPFKPSFTFSFSTALLLLAGCGGISEQQTSDIDAATKKADATITEADATPEPDACHPGVTISYSGNTLPVEISGFYDEAFDCVLAEGGSNNGNADSTHCFRKSDGTTWRIWNTGCGWEIGWVVSERWQRHARTYSGLCSDIPPHGLTTQALTTNLFFNGFGDPIAALGSSFEDCMP